MAEHYPTKLPDGMLPYRVVLVESAMRAYVPGFVGRRRRWGTCALIVL